MCIHATGCRGKTTACLRLRFLEHGGLQPVALQELVEFGSIALRQSGGLSDVTRRDLEQPHEIIALELLARLLERRENAGILAQGALHERRRNDAGGRQSDGLLEQV